MAWALLGDGRGFPAIADDSGLEVEALGDAPGVYSARYAVKSATDADNCEKLLQELKRSHRAKALAELGEEFDKVLIWLNQRLAEEKPPKPDHSEFEHDGWS